MKAKQEKKDGEINRVRVRERETKGSLLHIHRAHFAGFSSISFPLMYNPHPTHPFSGTSKGGGLLAEVESLSLSFPSSQM